MLNSSPKTFSSRSTLPVLPPMYGAVFLAISLSLRPDLDDGALGAGDRAAQQDQVLVRDHVDDLEAALGHALVAHLAGAADALEHARRCGGRADRARGAHVVRAVRDGAAAEAVALDRSLEALALRDAGDLDGLALLEDVDGQLLANLEALALAAELAQVAQRRVARLLQVAELGLRQLALGHVAVAELHGVVAVALGRPQAGNPARARLHDRDALDGAVLHEQLRHPDLRSEQSRHQTNWIWMSTPAGRWSSRWSESTVFGVG